MKKADKLTPGIELASLPNDSPELTQVLQKNAINALNEFKAHLQARGIRFLFPAHFLYSLYEIKEDDTAGFKFVANSTDFEKMIEIQNMREQNTEPEPDEPIIMKPPQKDNKIIDIKAKNRAIDVSGSFQ